MRGPVRRSPPSFECIIRTIPIGWKRPEAKLFNRERPVTARGRNFALRRSRPDLGSRPTRLNHLSASLPRGDDASSRRVPCP
ncbi:protein of unknown function [Methylorubrum extorquens]|uniref:Uncharacterized protein n=1 Tax=Methylorubrum extorquens TaxID=408 RepID=A0A2N9ASW3_METEX|nr:protein of unknown function [Methylorubrum extorquens]